MAGKEKEKEQPKETAPSCPNCKTTMQEASWPPKEGGAAIATNGVVFLTVFAWLFSGALTVKPSGRDNDLFLNNFRLYAPLVLGLLCLAWGWAILTGRRVLGKQETVWHCPSCEHAEAKS